MRTDLYWVPGPWPGRLAVMPRPRGGDWLEDEVRSWKRSGIDVVLSLLTPDEVTELGLAGEEELCRANGIELLSLPVPDRGVPPSQEAASAVVAKLAERLADGKGVAVHCRQGIGRAGLIAAGLLVAAGTGPEAALQRVSTARGCAVPETPEQRRWVSEFAESLLSRSPK
jgi:protein-tyrosine phosphatase